MEDGSSVGRSFSTRQFALWSSLTQVHLPSRTSDNAHLVLENFPSEEHPTNHNKLSEYTKYNINVGSQTNDLSESMNTNSNGQQISVKVYLAEQN